MLVHIIFSVVETEGDFQNVFFSVRTLLTEYSTSNCKTFNELRHKRFMCDESLASVRVKRGKSLVWSGYVYIVLYRRSILVYIRQFRNSQAEIEWSCRTRPQDYFFAEFNFKRCANEIQPKINGNLTSAVEETLHNFFIINTAAK